MARQQLGLGGRPLGSSAAPGCCLDSTPICLPQWEACIHPGRMEMILQSKGYAKPRFSQEKTSAVGLSKGNPAFERPGNVHRFPACGRGSVACELGELSNPLKQSSSFRWALPLKRQESLFQNSFQVNDCLPFYFVSEVSGITSFGLKKSSSAVNSEVLVQHFVHNFPV